MIELRKITKNFGNIQALDNFSFDVKKGELFGLLGPNGAGKSTTINLLSTFIAPDKGEIFLNGISHKKATLKMKMSIGVIPQEIALYDDLSALENLQFWGDIYQIPTKELKNRITEMLKMVGLFGRRKDKIKTFSGGMKRRINIAAGLLHNPNIILMDEPTVGVDPQSRNFIFEMIKGLHQIGKTIIYTTHYMEEAERLCQRIAIIDQGKLIAIGTKEELYKLLGDSETIILELSKNLDIEQISHFFGNFIISDLSENKIKIEGINLKNNLSEITTYLKRSFINIEKMDYIKPNLEKLFLKLTGKELRE
ncbi:MAG: ATP-binding cassette domain-containing protein [Candidatus Cloacimonetes bacterium]|nr:ATP-binding cassette domain-containing protein [Candidatus Cloacimonadota bacterium]